MRRPNLGDSSVSPRGGTRQDVRFTAGVFTFSIACSAIECFAGLVAADALWALLLVVLLAGLFIGRAYAAARERRGRPVRLLLIVATLNLFLLAPELVLRLTKFRYVAGIQFGHPNPTQFSAFQWDSSLFWKFRPDRAGVNSWGFAGPEVVTPKPAGAFRVLYLGDSCTWQSYPGASGQSFSYASIATSLVNRDGAQRVENVTLATPGYSSHQGRVVAERYARVVSPDLTMVFFG